MDDGIQGSGIDQFNFKGSWTHTSNLSTEQYFDGTVSSSSSEKDVTVVMFSGTRIQVYGPEEPDAGIARIAIDNDGGRDVDQYHSPAIYLQLLYDSGPIVAGTHKFTFKCTGIKNSSSSAISVFIDYVKVTP